MKLLFDKKSIERGYQIFKKGISQEYLKFKYPLWTLVFSFIFQSKSTEIIKSILVKPLLSSVDDSTTSLNIFFVIGCISIIATLIYVLSKGYKLSKTFSYWIVTASVIYIHYRFFTIEFIYKRLKGKSLEKIYYTDIILILATALLFYYLIIIIKSFKAKNEVNSKDGFYTDVPIIIKNKETDINNRLEYINELKNKILATISTETSFAIGIIGKWGSGKTTFINTLEDLLSNEKKIIQLKFNPWMAGSPEKIIELFFSDLSITLGKYDGNLKDKLLKYSKELLKSIDDNGVSSIIKIFDKGSNNLSLVKQNIEISASIESLNKRIIIYIDDVDRLDNKESIEVLRLIRNTANFRNTFFVVAFDRNYLIDSIKDALSGNTDSYIEKIFQLEYYLPLNNDKKLYENQFYDLLLKYLDEPQKEILFEFRKPSSKITFIIDDVEPTLGHYIKTFRDVKRLLNVLLLNFDRIKNNIYLPNYILINVLRLKFPEVYNELYHNKHKYLDKVFTREAYSTQTHKLTLNYKGKVDGKMESTLLYIDLSSNKISLTLEKLKEAISLVNIIFPPKTGHAFSKVSQLSFNEHLSITEASCFNRYFDFSLEGRLDENEYKIAFSKSLEDFKEFISKAVLANVTTDLQVSLEKTQFFSKDEFEKLIWGIIHFTNLPSPINPPFKNLFNPNAFVDLFGGMTKDYNNVLKNIYGDDIASYEKFIWELFDSPLNKDYSSYMFKLSIFILKRFSDELIITHSQIKNWCKKIYTDFLNRNNKLSSDVWDMYNQTIQIYTEEEVVEKKELGLLFKEFIVKNDFAQFLKDIIIPCQRNQEHKKRLNDFYITLFDTEEAFLEELKNPNQNIDACNEFLEFFNKLKESGDLNCVKDFTFNFLI